MELRGEASDENLNTINNHNGEDEGRKNPRWKQNYHLIVTMPMFSLDLRLCITISFAGEERRGEESSPCWLMSRARYSL